MNIALLEDLGCSAALLAENAEKLKDMGHNFTAYARADNPEELKKRVASADVIMLANMPLPAPVLAAAPEVKFIDVAFTGVDHIPVQDAKRRGIAISNASGYADEAVAELAISCMIQLLRDLDKAQERVRQGGTKAGLRANLLQGKTVGIIGCGAIGRRVAALCKAFGARVIVHNRHEIQDANIDANASLAELLRTADIVSLHCPLTPETRGMLGQKQLEMMKNSAFLINTARGQVVDNAALAEALNSGQIAGAAVDVFDMEPPLPPDYPLLKAKNAILTPHLAFYSQESLEERARIAFANLYAWLAGRQINAV